jgi:serine protease AprX
LSSAAVPALAAAPAAPVRAVVLVQPGVALPLQVPGGRVRTVLPHVHAEIVTAPLAALRALASDPRVAGVSPDRAGRVTGDDSVSGVGNGVFAAQALGGSAGQPDTGKGVNIALLDTGLTDTPALNRASGRVTDGVDVSQLRNGGDAITDPNASPNAFQDGYGHGTFLASLIAGGKVPGSGSRAIGIAPAARIVVVKVADNDGYTSLSEVLAGMDFVASHARAINVVNLALAIDRPTGTAYGADPLTAAVDWVRAAGVVVVASAGNTPGQVGDPGLDPQALTVGAADVSKGAQVAPFSGSGNVDGVAKPDVVAPGVHVLGVINGNSAIAAAHPEGKAGNGLFKGSGTSEATAIATGVVAAYLSNNPGASVQQVKTVIRAQAHDLKDARAGQGLISLVDGHFTGKPSAAAAGEAGLDAAAWQNNAWTGLPDWQSHLAQMWSGPAWNDQTWSPSAFSAVSWSAVSWSAVSWSAVSWSAVSWSAVSWSAVSWSAVSWSAVSWSDYGWGDT